MKALRSLNHDEAVERGRLIGVDRYDIAVDLTGLLEGPEFRATSTVRFSCREPGGSTFVDCAADVVTATLNGEPVGADAIGDSRIMLTGLRADNELVVESVQRSTDQATAVHRAVDPADGEVYVWTSFEPDEARRAWACFDQPDLKAPFAFTVTAPAGWTVVSNSGEPRVDDVEETDQVGPGARRWTFPATPPLSTYIPVINAGPFHDLRRERDGYDLGLYARRSLAPFLDRDADEMFELTAAGLAFYGERFALPFPQRTYDQVFVPEMGGAMENYGCVTWSDALLYRTEPSPEDRQVRAEVLLHEMAHMWFGDIVTMRWWDDLWLNEAFADWACYWSATAATPFTDSWASFLASGKLGGYRSDQGPVTHPIRQPARDVAQATAGFDAITYAKGASVLKQLVAYLGEDVFIDGLRSYFAAYAWKNATLDDLMGELSRASGHDLSRWTRAWLDTAGPDVLELEPAEGDGAYVLRATGPHDTAPRPHRLNLGVYDHSDGILARRTVISVETAGRTTEVPDIEGGRPALVLVNDDDLTFAVTRPDPESRSRLLADAGRLPTALSRAVAVSTAWELLMSGTASTAEFVSCVNSALAAETAEAVVEPYLQLAVQAAERWSPESQRARLCSSVADVCLELAEADDARRLPAVRGLARTATTESQLEALRTLVGDNVDLGWRELTRLAALDRLDPARVAALRERDPDPDSWVHALMAESAQPNPSAKESAWRAVMDEHKVPIGMVYQVATAFWQPGQDAQLEPFGQRYIDALPALGGAGMIVAMSAAQAMFPLYGVGQDFIEQVESIARSTDVRPVVGSRVLERADQLRKMLAARQA